MKRAGVIPSTLRLKILPGGFLYLNPLMPIITGYAAKNLSSAIFVANRTQESMEATNLIPPCIVVQQHNHAMACFPYL